MKKKLPNVDIVVLGALYGKPLHAYDIKKLIIKLDIGKQSWGGFSLSSVYYSIKRLIKKKYILEQKQEKISFHPNRIIYQITETGKNKLFSEIKSVFLDPRAEFLSFEIACSLICIFKKEEILEIINKRKDILIEKKKFLMNIEKLKDSKLPFTAHIIFRSNVLSINAHLEICDYMIEEIKKSERFDFIPSIDILNIS